MARFALRRADGRYFQAREVVRGFLWETPPFVWVRPVRFATKFETKTLARLVAFENSVERVTDTVEVQ